MPTERLIQVAVGKVIPPQHWTDDLRIRAALKFDEFQVDVPGLLEGKTESDVQSRWLFPPAAANPADPEIPF
jgi:hypothetical protein